MAFVEISEGLADHHVEKREDGEQVAKADVEVSSDTDITIEEDKEYRQILGYIVMEGMSQEKREGKEFFLGILSSDTIQTIDCREEQEEEKRECFFESKNNREVRGGGFDRDRTEEVVNIASRNAGENLGDTNEVLCEGKEEWRRCHVDDDIMSHSGRGIGLRKEEVGMLNDFLSGHARGIQGIENPNGSEANNDDGEELPRIGKERSESMTKSGKRCFVFGTKFGEGVEYHKQSKNRKEQYRGKFN